VASSRAEKCLYRLLLQITELSSATKTVPCSLEPRLLLAVALRELGKIAGKVSNLTITTEMLPSLLNPTPAGGS
jgi:hypothetical protein